MIILEYTVALHLILMVAFALFFKYQHSIPPLLRTPYRIVFVIADYLLNWLLSIWLLDPPRGWGELVTGRLIRYKAEETGIRLKYAQWLCRWLNRFDPDHC